MIGTSVTPNDIAPGKVLLAGEQKNIENRHRCSPRPNDVVPVEAKRPKHAQDKEMHSDSGDKRNPSETARQQPEREPDLDERGGHPQPVKRRRGSWNDIGDGRDDPGKLVLHEVQVDLLQPREEVCASHDQASDVERAVASDRVLAVPGKQSQRREQETIQKDPRLPTGLIEQAENDDDSEERNDELLWLRRDENRCRQRKRGAKQHLVN